VGVPGTPPVKPGLLPDQAVGTVLEPITLAGFVFDLAEQQARVVVAVAQLAAVGVDPAADQVQVVGVLVAGDPPQLIAFGGDLAIGVVAEGASGAAGQGGLQQPADGIPLVLADGAMFVLAADLPAQHVVGIAPLAAVRQLFFDQLAKPVPAQ